MKKQLRWYAKVTSILSLTVLGLGTASPGLAYLPGAPTGGLDPTTIPKYVIPLVIPPEMPKSTASPLPAADYDIAVRQFKQQILPGGIWDVLGGTAYNLPPTTVWSYGRAEDPPPNIQGLVPSLPAGVAPAPNSTFNYPAFTVETMSAQETDVRWINDLVQDPQACAASNDKTIAACNYLPHLFKVDQTLHWANPPQDNCDMGDPKRTDCHTMVAAPYTGPVPLVTHVHGAHLQPESDGYPEGWWLPGVPGTKGIPSTYAERGSIFTQANTKNTIPGTAFYSYENTQPATTLWYHDHAMGMTRLNVYAGPAGFWLVRGGANGDDATDDFTTAAASDGVLPGPAPSVAGGDPNFDANVRKTIREIPIAIQDRSFRADGSLFYPESRAFFDGYTGPYIGGAGAPAGPSDMPSIWNPEAFFNTMVVNGTTWPVFDVAPARYRLRLLDGCNSRTINLSLRVVDGPGADTKYGTGDDLLGAEVPFFQIGAEQGFLPQVVEITTGFATPLPGDGTIPLTKVASADPTQGLLMGPAERADVIVDFSALPLGATRLRMINTGPDAPFQGLPLVPADVADPLTTGQVMDFVVNQTALASDATSTKVENLLLPAEAPLPTPAVGAPALPTRQLSLNEMESGQVCIEVDAAGAIVGTLFSVAANDTTPPYTSATFLADCANYAPVGAGNSAVPMAPRQALLGVMTKDGQGNLTGSMPMAWMDAVTENPAVNDTEIWEIYNTTMDAHPIHLHLVRFEVIDRQDYNMMTFAPMGVATGARPNELGFKDTVLAYPGQITRLKAKFDIAGLYVWHCHIVEHEDNEMMRPYIVGANQTLAIKPGWNLVSSFIAKTADLFGDDSKYASVWKWTNNKWQVSLPGEANAGAFAKSKGFGQLNSIKPGEGLWVNSMVTSSLLVTGSEVSSTPLSIGKGWKLMGPPQNAPLTVAAIMNAAPVGTTIQSIWKWVNNNWEVYLPAEAVPGTYATAMGFGQLSVVNPGEGFWVMAN